MGTSELRRHDTALEGSLRATFRLTVCKPGSGDTSIVAYRYPSGETHDA